MIAFAISEYRTDTSQTVTLLIVCSGLCAMILLQPQRNIVTDFDKMFEPSNKFVVSLQVIPSTQDDLKLRKYLNLHYLDDVDANELVDGTFKAKYPEKETEDYKNAMDRVWRGYNVNLSVTIDENGIPTFEVL